MMSPMRRFAAVALLAFAATAAGCSTEPGEEVETPLECEDGNECELPLEEEASFVVTLMSTSCEYAGNEIRITAPVNQLLSSDACYHEVGTEWEFAGPYPAGTELDFSMQSRIIDGQPALRASGAYPVWTINFEDGADTDFNDIVLRVEATPVAP